MIDHYPIYCTDRNCHLPVARIINGALVIVTRHNGEKHEGVLSLDVLKQLLEQNSLTAERQTVLSSDVMAESHL